MCLNLHTMYCSSWFSLWLIISLYEIISSYLSLFTEHTNWVWPGSCANFFRVRQSFNNTEIKLLNILLWWQKKCVANNVWFVENGNIGCISLTIFFRWIYIHSFPDILSLVIFLSSLSSPENRAGLEILLRHTLVFLPVWLIFDKGIHLPTNRVRARFVLHRLILWCNIRTEEVLLSFISNNFKGHIISNMCSIPTQIPCFWVLSEGKSE